MKIKCEVSAVKTNGDSLIIEAEGITIRAAAWRCMSSICFDVPDTKKNRQTFHVGRALKIEIKP